MKGISAVRPLLFSLGILLFSFFLLPAQQWDPIVSKGKMWVSVESDAIAGPSPAWAISHKLRIGDTLNFYGTLYHLLEISHTAQAQQWFSFGLLREDSTGKVWFQTFTCGPERLVYDMGASSGSTVVITHTTPGTHQVSGSYHVGAVDSVFLAGKLRKRLQVGSGYWIEGIGSTAGLMFSGLEDVAGYNYALLCYYEDSALLHTNDHLNPFYPACWADITTGIATPLSTAADIFPNPASNEITLPTSLTKGSIQVFDQQGRECSAFTGKAIGQKLEVRHLPPGLYFIRVVDEEKVYQGKFVKQ